LPRFEQLAAHREHEELEARLGGAAFYVVRTVIEPVVRNDTGKPCPLTGSDEVRSLGRMDDLEFIVQTNTGSRLNGWSIMTPGQREAYQETVSEAAPDGPDVKLVDCVWQCTEDFVDVLQSDPPEVVYFSGGWRGMKTFRADQLWCRQWAKHGGRGELFWVLGPQLSHAQAHITKIFLGRSTAPSVLPRDENGPLLTVTPIPGPKAKTLSVTMLDYSIVRGFHAEGSIGHLEGEAVRAVRVEEAARISSSAAMHQARSRVMQHGGPVILSSVPDDDGEWLYDEIVAPWQRGEPDLLVVESNGLDNPWLPKAHYWRMHRNTRDPVQRAQKVEGKWTRAGMYAYVDVFDEPNCVLRGTADPAEVQNLLGLPDITEAVVRRSCGIGGRDWKIPPWYLMCDFNFDPQTQVLARVYGDLKDWRTWRFAFLREFIGRFKDAEEAAAELSTTEGGTFAGAAGCCDANGLHNPHRYPTKVHASLDASAFRKYGFRLVGPIAHLKVGRNELPSYRNPGIADSRRVMRYLMRDNKILVSEVGCPRVLNMVRRAPNRRKEHRDSGARIDREIYNVEDCCRYGVFRAVGKQVLEVAIRTRGDEERDVAP
jgi:hypothetical protein